MCQLYCRLLTALLTFAVGLAASTLWGLWRTPSKPHAAPAAAAPRVVAPPVRPSVGPRDGAAAPRLVGTTMNAKAISKPAPAYPPAAKAARVEGTVAVHVVVGVDGRVETARAVSGPELLQQAAADAVSHWRFSPTLLAGRPVEVDGVVTVNFVLQ